MSRKKKISITAFKEFLAESLLNIGDTNENRIYTLEEAEEVDQRNRKIRKCCITCSAKNRTQLGSREADKASVIPRVTTYCLQCPKTCNVCKLFCKKSLIVHSKLLFVL